MKRILMMIIFTLSIVCIYKTEVKALSGNGAANNPFIVKSGSDLESALSKGSDSWKYVAIRDTVAVKEMITVDSGKFRIYASGANQTIRRSQSMDATVNSASKPLRCMKIEGLDAELTVASIL